MAQENRTSHSDEEEPLNNQGIQQFPPLGLDKDMINIVETNCKKLSAQTKPISDSKAVTRPQTSAPAGSSQTT